MDIEAIYIGTLESRLLIFGKLFPKIAQILNKKSDFLEK